MQSEMCPRHVSGVSRAKLSRARQLAEAMDGTMVHAIGMPSGSADIVTITGMHDIVGDHVDRQLQYSATCGYGGAADSACRACMLERTRVMTRASASITEEFVMRLKSMVSRVLLAPASPHQFVRCCQRMARLHLVLGCAATPA